MRKKRMKANLLACVLICSLPVTTSFAMDKEDFFRYLINSSYPETNENNAENTNNNDKKDSVSVKDNDNEKDNKDDYIKVHIGEENIPKLNSEKEYANKEDNTDTSINYKDNVRVTGEKPRILIYHSHAGETYADSSAGNYHSKDRNNSVIKIGDLLTTELTNKGWGVVHNTTYNDYPSHNSSYLKSLETMKSMMNNYNDIDITIDLHRDGRTIYNESSKKKYHDEHTTKINGESVAKISFVVGMKNNKIDGIMKIANDLTNLANEKYPGLARPVSKNKYGRYNQLVSKNAILIEVGSNAVSTKEASASVKYIADVLDSYFK